MNSTFPKSLYIILASFGLSFIFNFLFFAKEIGISILIFSTILLGTAFLFGQYQHFRLRRVWWLILPILFFALMPSIRANEFLIFLNLCAILGLFVLLAHEMTGTPTFLMGIADYFIMIVFMPFQMLSRALSTIVSIGQIHNETKNRNAWIRIIKSALMAVPILIIFGALFSQADLAFSKFINSFVAITISERTIQYLILLCFAFVASLSFLSYIFFHNKTRMTPEKPDVAERPGREIEILVFLGLIAVLFLIFIGFQITYLFGGETNIVKAGFTYAEYAHHGFWELVSVAMLSLLVLLASEKYTGAESGNNRFLIPALILISEVIIVIVSAFKRLSLYIDAYSMTELRFYVAGFIILLLVLFILLAVKFIKTKEEHFFTFGTLLSFVAFLIIVNIVNPDSFIATSNLKRYYRTGKIDVLYVGNLSVDAELKKIELYKKLEDKDKETLRRLFQKEKDRLQKSIEWQSTNISRAQALKLLNELEK